MAREDLPVRRVPAIALSVTLHPAHDPAQRRHVALLAGRLGYAAVVAPAGIEPAELDLLREAAGPARVLVAGEDAGPGLLRTADPDAVRRTRSLLGEGGRVVVDVPVAIGRTRAEAVARAARDARFVGDAHPERDGIFGTFEQAQLQVLDLARAGADELRVTLADEVDLADLLAQTRALVVGPAEALLRGSARRGTALNDPPGSD